jgi:hypothetical protein
VLRGDRLWVECRLMVLNGGSGLDRLLVSASS